MEVELSNVQSALEYLSPKVDELASKVDSLESTRDLQNGKLDILVRIGRITIVMLTGLFLAFAAWALSHVIIRAEFTGAKPKITTSQKQEPAYAEDKSQMSGNEDRAP